MTKCNVEHVQLFLQQGLSTEEQQAFERHLEYCPHCVSQLDTYTAEIHWWEEASKLLPDAEDDLQPLARTGSSGAGMAEHVPDGGSTIPAAIQSVLQTLAPTDDPARLGRVGNYEVAGVVGAGGMSVVLKAFDASLNRFVAIKVLAPHLATGGASRKRFAREAQAAAAIVHENVIAIHGVDEARGLPYLVMPYVKGESLQSRLNTQGALELKEILRIAHQTAAGLAAAHAQGLIHRDVKPANILLADGVERVTITDFGLARAADDASLTRSGTIAGTPQYMSPEQARGEMVDQRSDLFSLGSVIYAMCTGRPPFCAESSYGVLRQISDARPRPIRELNSDLPVWLATLVDRLHAKLPQDRYPSAAAVAEDLEQSLAHVQQPDREPLPSRLRISPHRRRWRTITLVVLAGVAILLAVLGSSVRGRWSTLFPAEVSTNLRQEPSPYAGSSQMAPSVPSALSSAVPAEPLEPVPAQPTDAPALWWDSHDEDLKQLEWATSLLESELEYTRPSGLR